MMNERRRGRHDERSLSGPAADAANKGLARDGEVLDGLPGVQLQGLEMPAFTGSFYFDIDDVTALWADLKDRVKIAYPMEEFQYGMREFAIYDNNGYMLQFGTPSRS